MNIIKATIATAAVITCCMSNDYPAQAGLSRRELKTYEAGYRYGYSYGMLAKTCLFYVWGNVSSEDLEFAARHVRNDKDLEPYFVKQIANHFREMGQEKQQWSQCASIVLPILQPTNNYRNADNWY